jgi:hypothetical protein
MTARTSSIRVSSVGTSLTRSETPVPRLSNQITRATEERLRSQATMAGWCQAYSAFEITPGTNTRSGGPSPRTW